MARILFLLSLLILLPTHAASIHPDALRPFIDRGCTYSLVSFRLVGQVVELQSGFFAVATRSSAKMLEGLKVTAKQTAKDVQPPEWILVDLIVPAPDGGEDEVESTVAVRNDNFYIVGVTDGGNLWNCFAGTEDLITGCKRLPFTGDYSAEDGLMARSALNTVPLGRGALVQAVYDFRGRRTTEELDGAAPTTDERMKVSLAGAAITISEAARFKEISDLLQAGWESGTVVKDPERFKYWSRLSCELARGWATRKEVKAIAKAFGVPEGTIVGKEWAAGLLNVAIYGKACEAEIDALL